MIIFLTLLFALIFWILYRRAGVMENPISRMRALDKNDYFLAQITKAQLYYDSIVLHREQNRRTLVTNPTVRDTYTEIYEKIEHRLDSIERYIKHFDYVAYRQADDNTIAAIEEALSQIKDLIDKLNRLDNINIKIENSMLDNDTDRINFLIESLEELNDEGK
jgi:hypothetical protein